MEVTFIKKLILDSELIWLGEDELNRKVVVKFFDYGDNDLLIASAKVLVRVNHSNIVNVYSIEQLEHPETKNYTECIVMEYIDGETLTKFLNKVISEDETYHIGNQLISAIEATHQNGLVHGDLHDENILITKDSRVIVIDMFPRGSFTKVSDANRALRIQGDLVSLTRILIQIIRNSEISLQTSQFSKLLNTKERLSIPYIKDVFVKKPKCSVKGCEKDAIIEVFLYDKYSHNGDEFFESDYTCPYLCGDHQIENEKDFKGIKAPRRVSYYPYTNCNRAQGFTKYKFIDGRAIFSNPWNDD